MRLLGTVGFGIAARSAGDGHVRRDLLPRAMAGQERQQHCEITPPRNHLLDTDQRDVHSRDRRREPPVAFVRDEHDLTGLGNQEVATRNTAIGRQKCVPQTSARKGRQLLGLIGQVAAGHL
jgi:hypothetical protein